jgi:hypothetical protein
MIVNILFFISFFYDYKSFYNFNSSLKIRQA